MRTRILTASLLALGVFGATAAHATPCGDQIAKLQASAAQTDAKNKPGNQAQPTDTGSAQTKGTEKAGANSPSGDLPKQSAASAGGAGGGTQSASAKILEAQAHDGRGDQAACMKAVDEAKKLLDS